MSDVQPGSLVCANRHCFDVSSKGYVNFAANTRPPKYHGELFESRRIILESGFYQPILETLRRLLSEYAAPCILDAGCGEGYYASQLSAGSRVFAFDLSKDAVRMAAKRGGDVLWMVADLAGIPLRDGCADILLNIFAPANYAEFARVLRRGGLLVKVLPGAEHLRQLRDAARDQLGAPDYSNRRVIDCFDDSFGILHRIRVCNTLAVKPAMQEHLLKMTPLMLGVDAGRLQPGGLCEITIDAEIVVGRR